MPAMIFARMARSYKPGFSWIILDREHCEPLRQSQDRYPRSYMRITH